MRLRGFDASSVQGRIPFWLLSPDLRFGILKAQQGNDGLDPTFARNVQAALDEGREPFAYCFAYPLPENGNASRSPKAQAALFVTRTEKIVPGRPLFLDFEWPEYNDWKKWGCSASQINDWCRDCANEVKRLSGVTPVIYTYPYWWASVSKGTDISWASEFPLWIASYPKDVGWPDETKQPVIPKPWSEWLFWQFDGNGGLKLPNGVDSDFCLFNGDEAALQSFAKGTPLSRPVGDGVLGAAAISDVLRK